MAPKTLRCHCDHLGWFGQGGMVWSVSYLGVGSIQRGSKGIFPIEMHRAKKTSVVSKFIGAPIALVDLYALFAHKKYHTNQPNDR